MGIARNRYTVYYVGIAAPNEPFTVSEIKPVLFHLNGRSAPAPDGVTNKLLRNLDDRAIEIITAEINEV